MCRFQAIKAAMFDDSETLGIVQVDELTEAILLAIVKFYTDVKLVRPKVVDTNGVYRLLVLQHIIDEKPKRLVMGCDNGK